MGIMLEQLYVHFCSKLIKCFSNESGTFIICEHLQRFEREVGEEIELYAIFEKKNNLEIIDVTGFGEIVKREALI